jgi:hypothetical protein
MVVGMRQIPLFPAADQPGKILCAEYNYRNSTSRVFIGSREKSSGFHFKLLTESEPIQDPTIKNF